MIHVRKRNPSQGSGVKGQIIKQYLPLLTNFLTANISSWLYNLKTPKWRTVENISHSTLLSLART